MLLPVSGVPSQCRMGFCLPNAPHIAARSPQFVRKSLFPLRMESDKGVNGKSAPVKFESCVVERDSMGKRTGFKAAVVKVMASLVLLFATLAPTSSSAGGLPWDRSDETSWVDTSHKARESYAANAIKEGPVQFLLSMTEGKFKGNCSFARSYCCHALVLSLV